MLKNLKSLFIIEEDSSSRQAKAEEITTGPEKSGAVKTATNPSTPARAQQPVKGAATNKFREILFRAIEENNLEGFDYLEFRNSLISLQKMQMDEKTRFQSAAAMAQTMGVKTEEILQTADHYLNVLKLEENKFQEALANQRVKQIGSKEEELKQLEAVVKQKSAQIQQLQKEITASQQKATALESEIEAAVVKVEQTSADFEASYESVANQIMEDVNKIKTYLQNKSQ